MATYISDAITLSLKLHQLLRWYDRHLWWYDIVFINLVLSMSKYQFVQIAAMCLMHLRIFRASHSFWPPLKQHLSLTSLTTYTNPLCISRVCFSHNAYLLHAADPTPTMAEAAPPAQPRTIAAGLTVTPPNTLPTLQSTQTSRSGGLTLDTLLSPVTQGGSFEFDRIIKSGEVLKRTRRTKVCRTVGITG